MMNKLTISILTFLFLAVLSVDHSEAVAPTVAAQQEAKTQTAEASVNVKAEVEQMQAEAAETVPAEASEQARSEPTQAKDTRSKWAKLGEEMGKALGGAARELNMEPKEFLETSAGKTVERIIFWEAMGEDVWEILGGSIAWLAICGVILWSFRHFHMKVKVVDEQEQMADYIKLYEFPSEEAEAISILVHVGLFVFFTIIALVIVFT
ncbi:hypothetical protein ACFL2D_01285 [Patescibacteria group bacterium]